MTHATQIIRRVSATDVATLDYLLNSAVEDVIPDPLHSNKASGLRESAPETTASKPPLIFRAVTQSMSSVRPRAQRPAAFECNRPIKTADSSDKLLNRFRCWPRRSISVRPSGMAANARVVV